MEQIAGVRLLAQLGKHNPIDNRRGGRNPETGEWWNNKPLTQRYPLTSQTSEPAFPLGSFPKNAESRPTSKRRPLVYGAIRVFRH